MSEEKGNGPLQTLNDGPLFVKIWRQDGTNGPFVTSTSGRIYRDNETGEIKETSSLTVTGTKKMSALQQKAHGEMDKWQEYLKELAPKPEEKPAQSLTAQRDEVLAQAKPPQRDDGPALAPER